LINFDIFKYSKLLINRVYYFFTKFQMYKKSSVKINKKLQG